ncbi:MAG: hypothetical protein ACD_42C00522G0005 [uncultured bacterium]|nr:MAG: hypothetical protein ACD_42C00522G0005 [uncultured bacterium]OGT34506.1 MAG: hypothetical protein A3C44_08080 [Gammaproteobacteria bacterium RIFCSPHIGHO2_02_FULL_39_13]OGT50567.1 MAG: hypothetical protein A3E53_03495 [Gammaproteobacteria bacterium RIFCSPHIGHO2_12_FULL_39_24]
MRLTFSIALAISGFFATTSVFAVNDTDDYGLNKITHDHNITMYKTGIQWALNSKTTLRAGFNHGEGVLSLSCATENIFSLDATEKVSKKDFINGVLTFIPKQILISRNLFSGSANQIATVAAYSFGVGLSWSRVLA